MFARGRTSVTLALDPRPMQLAPIRTPEVGLAVSRTGSRAVRAIAFTLETWSRLRLDGAKLTFEERARELAWVAENTCAVHGVRTRVRGDVPREPALLVANHVTYFDPLVIASSVPCTAVAKREVADWPCIGEMSRRLGVLFVDRNDPLSGARALRTMLRAFECGVSVLVFPEGTTTRGDGVLPFKRGSFGAAALAGVPVVPVALRYHEAHAPWVGNELFVPHYLRTMAEPCTQVSLEFLPALSPLRRAPELTAERARRAIVERLARSDGPLGRVASFEDGHDVAFA
jgi:lyso-ornithine lipid O-acyltransferase